MSRTRTVSVLLAVAAFAGSSAAIAQVADAGTSRGGHRHHSRRARSSDARGTTVTPIRHLVVIYQENVSFDHYFGTYPNAANTDGQNFAAAPGTPAVDGLPPATDASLPAGLRHSSDLLSSANPNNPSLPVRLDSSRTGLAGGAGGQLTCDQDHNYSDEQKAFDGGAMDYFVQSVGATSATGSPWGGSCDPKQVMDYYDGNTVTALWNYAQRYAMSDNSYSTTFGPSSPGAINLVAGNTAGVDTNTGHMANNPSVATSSKPNADLTSDGNGGFSLTSDAQPFWDDCSTRDAVALTGKNVGDLLNTAGLSWGWFQGGFRPTTTFAAASAQVDPDQTTAEFNPDEFKGSFTGKNVPPNASNQALCDTVHPVGVALGGNGTGTKSAGGTNFGFKDDYIAHHEPFQYYASTANPHHLTIPTDGSGRDTLAGLSEIGSDTQSYDSSTGAPQFNTPNHQYDMSDFDQLVAAISRGDLPPSALPAVSFLKAPGYQDGHAVYSDPADEQAFITSELNALMRTPDWPHTAVVIAYDDSDGWYDHANPGVINPSLSAADNLTPTNKTGATSGQCGPNPQPSGTPLGGEQGRCGFGPRQPLVVISPFAARNHVDHNLSDQASVPNFIEYNWRLPGISGSADQVLTGTDTSEGIPFDLAGLFDFGGPRNQGPLLLDPATGQPVGG